jgi:hypothetical protein
VVTLKASTSRSSPSSKPSTIPSTSGFHTVTSPGRHTNLSPSAIATTRDRQVRDRVVEAVRGRTGMATREQHAARQPLPLRSRGCLAVRQGPPTFDPDVQVVGGDQELALREPQGRDLAGKGSRRTYSAVTVTPCRAAR